MEDQRPTQRTIPLPLAVLLAAGALVVGVILGWALNGGDGSSELAIPTPAVTGAPTVSASTTTTPSTSTSSSGADSLSLGQASLSLTGSINATVTFGRLAPGASWAPPPAEIALSCLGPGAQTMTLEGASFTSQVVTDAEHTLSFTVNVGDAPVTFVSTEGQCTVTISPALPTEMGGTLFCTNLPSTDGATIVNAQGTFAATG